MPELSDFQAWADSISLWQVIGWSAGIIGTVLFLIWFKRKGWPWLLGFARAILKTAQVIDAVQGLPAFITRTDATLEAQNVRIGEIHHEVHFNNGSSVKDAVTRVELGVRGLYTKVDELAAADDELRRDIDDTRPKPPSKETP